jgi:hypothetical protein
MQFKCKQTVSVLALIAVYGLLSGCDDILPPSARGVCVTGYNQYERHIHEFWLDNENKSGCHGNPPGRKDYQTYGGGGKFTCGCRITPGNEVSLYWSFAQDRKEFAARVPVIEKKIRVKVPEPESSSSRYLRVFFMKNGTAELQWVDQMSAPELLPPKDTGAVQ